MMRSFSVPYGISALFVLFCCFELPIEAVEGTCSCPDGWIYFQNSCYLFGEDGLKYSWTEAAHHCGLHRSHLVVIDNKNEYLFLKSLGQRLSRNETTRQSFWTGATDEVTEGLWVWYTDDSPLQYTNWAPGQPDSHGHTNEDCLCLNQPALDWHDCNCPSLFYTLCEMEISDTDLIVG